MVRYIQEGGRSLQEGKPGWWSARELEAIGMERRERGLQPGEWGEKGDISQ